MNVSENTRLLLTICVSGLLFVAIGFWLARASVPAQADGVFSGEFSSLSVFYERDQISRTAGRIYSGVPLNDTLRVDWPVNDTTGCSAIAYSPCPANFSGRLCLKCVE